MANEPKLDDEELRQTREVIRDHERRKWLRALFKSWAPWAIGAIGMFSAGYGFFEKVTKILGPK